MPRELHRDPPDRSRLDLPERGPPRALDARLPSILSAPGWRSAARSDHRRFDEAPRTGPGCVARYAHPDADMSVGGPSLTSIRLRAEAREPRSRPSAATLSLLLRKTNSRLRDRLSSEKLERVLIFQRRTGG